MTREGRKEGDEEGSKEIRKKGHKEGSKEMKKEGKKQRRNEGHVKQPLESFSPDLQYLMLFFLGRENKILICPPAIFTQGIIFLGSCRSAGRASCLATGGLLVRFSSPPIQMLRCPRARHLIPFCSRTSCLLSHMGDRAAGVMNVCMNG